MGASLGSLNHERFSKFKWWKVCISVFFLVRFHHFSTKKLGNFWEFFFSSVISTTFAKFFFVKTSRKFPHQKDEIKTLVLDVISRRTASFNSWSNLMYKRKALP